MRVSKFLWFLMIWSMALSVPLFVAPSKASAQTFPNCPSWAGVSGWTGGYTLTAKGQSPPLSAYTVDVSYRSSGVIHLTSGPQSCVTLTPTLGWSSTLDESNAIGSASYKSVYPCPDGGGTITSSWSASGIGAGSSATLTVDFSKGLLTLVPLAVSATYQGTVIGCIGNITALPYDTVYLTPPSSTDGLSFPLPEKAQEMKNPQNYTFETDDPNSGLTLTWTLTFQLTPDCDVPDSEASAFNGWALTQGQWEQTLVSGPETSYAGLFVKEIDAGGGKDTCWFLGSAYNPPVTTLQGGNLWPVNPDNTWGPDTVGWGERMLFYYRRMGRAPCGFTIHQQMHLVCYDGTEKSYGPVNTLKGTIGGNTVGSERANQAATRRY